MAIGVVMVCAMLFVGLTPLYGVVIFDDGASHYVDYNIFESVYVKGNTVVEFGLNSYVKYSTFTYDNSRVIVSGGRLEDDVWAADNSTVLITGGEFCWGTLNGNAIPRLRGMSNVTIVGSDFKLDGVSVSGVLDLPWSASPQYLTGTFLNGEYFSTAVDGHIILVPEPATLLLFGLGGLAMWRKNKRLK
jgi:hypothetical protein